MYDQPKPKANSWCVQFKIRTLVISFYTLSIALLWFVKMNACRSYCYTWCLAIQIRMPGTMLSAP
jgi:hypothetical protein